MATTFEALIAHGPGDLRYEEIPFRALGPTELLVKIESASLCNGSERNMYLGHPRYTYPMAFGHEPFGAVVERGTAVTRVAVGDEVSWWFSVGAYGEYCYVDTAQVGLAILTGDFDRGAASMLELATATSRALWASGVRPEHGVLIIGLGPSGLILTQLLRLAGVTQVEGWEVLPRRRRTGLAMGLTSTRSPIQDWEELCEQAGDEPYDLVFDCYGDDSRSDQATTRLALRSVRPGGTLIQYGHPSVPRELDGESITRKNLQVIEPRVPLWTVQDLIERQADNFTSGRLDLGALVTHRISFRDVESTLLDQIANPDDYLKAVVEM